MSTLAAAALLIAAAPIRVTAQDSRRATGLTAGDCQITAQKFVTATNAVNSRAGGVFSKLPESISFVQGGSSPGCVLISFTAEAKTQSTMIVQVRPTLDGAANGLPALVNLAAGAYAGYASHGMNFVFTGVSPGRHVLRIEFAAAATASLQGRSTILSYVK